MARNIKETLLSTLVHGQEVLGNIEVMRKVGMDHITKEKVTKASDMLHRHLELIVSDIKDTGKNARIIRFTSADGWLPPFEAGAYISIYVQIGGVHTSRPYSISSSPYQRAYYEITVAEVEGGFVSDHLTHKVKRGDCFRADGPAGVFTFDPCFHRPKSLFIAGGSGITPFMSMIREVSDRASGRDIVLLYGCRDKDAALYHEELAYHAGKCPGIRYHLILSEDRTYDGPKGFIDAGMIKRLAEDHKERTAYICGPAVMNEFCAEELRSLGMPRKQIRREMFGASRDITEEPGWPESIDADQVFRLKAGDRVVKARAGESLLTSLERAGIRVNVCCRSGECSLCRVRLVSGEVFMAKGMLRRYADEQYGYIHSCKAYPLSDVEIIL